MSYLGSYLGTTPSTPAVATPSSPDPVEAEIVDAPIEYVDHVESALSRLPLYAREKAT